MPFPVLPTGQSFDLIGSASFASEETNVFVATGEAKFTAPAIISSTAGPVSGCRSTTAPNGANASPTALGSAPTAPITPPSDMPFVPLSVRRLGVCIGINVIGGISPATGIA